MKISIICPLYMAEGYLDELHNNLLKQKNVDIESINYIVTKTNGKTVKKCERLVGCNYEVITTSEFSHSLVREDAARKVKGEILVFITQDIKILDDMWLYNLTKDIASGNCDAAFSRQICSYNTIEKYIREKNYPAISRTVCKDDIDRLGLITFFFSDAASAINRDIFLKLNGYDEKDLITNEDMYFAHKLITSGGRIKYCSESIVEHSHKFTLKQLFQRYFDTGVFFSQNSYLKQYKANDSGFSLLKSVIRRAAQDRNVKVILEVIPNFAARFIGMKLGQIHNKLSNRMLMNFSSSKSYFERSINK